MRHIEEHNHAQHPQPEDVETDIVDFPESRVDSLSEDPWDCELSHGYCYGTTKQGEPEILTMSDIGPEKTKPFHAGISSIGKRRARAALTSFGRVNMRTCASVS